MQKYPKTISDIGEVIREARKQQGLNQSDVAGLLGLGNRYLSELENGKSTIEAGKMLQILLALKIKVVLEIPNMSPRQYIK